MTNDDDVYDDLEEEYDDEPWIMFGEEMYNELSPVVKQFLQDYFGEKMYNLQSETYIEIEQSIREDFDYFDEIAEILFRHRTIKDLDKVDEAFNNFVPSQKPFIWKTSGKLFMGNVDDEDEDESEDSFLDYADPEDLTEDQLRARKIIDLADEILNEDRRYRHFMQAGYDVLNKEIRSYIEKYAEFDLSIMEPEGFEELEKHIDMSISMLLENLDSIINSD
ncbi:MAG TPA: hypothetical protein PLU49_04950 [Saprospiraceae bacterium]|nr:hypothetical protein [Saprospiraceae bacterium]